MSSVMPFTLHKNISLIKRTFSFLCLMTRYENFFDLKKSTNKMFLSVECSVVESFKFNGKNIRVVHIKKAVAYNDDDNARRAV